jgi:AcrR family transcriptional regulator
LTRKKRGHNPDRRRTLLETRQEPIKKEGLAALKSRQKTRRLVVLRAKKPYHHGDLRRALLETSLDLIEKEGVGALTLREVARRLGVSHAAPTYHFADKTALLAALAAQGFSEQREAATLAAERAGTDPIERLTARGAAYVSFAVQHPRLFRLMYGADLETSEDALLVEARERAYATLTDAVKEVMDSRGEVDPRRLVIAVAGCWATVHGLATLWIDERLGFAQEQFPKVEDLMRAVVDLMLPKVFEK